MRFWLFLAALLAAVSPAHARDRAFVAVEVADMAVSADWYAKTFGLTEANRFESSEVEQRLLAGDTLIVELIARHPATPRAAGGGLLKAGFEIADFDRHVAEWRAQGIAYPGRLETIYDSALKLHSRLLLDPDGNIIQVFGTSETLPR